jgi:hypothetical protein
MPRDDKAIARIVASATNDRHRTAAAQLQEHVHAPAACILHEHQARHAKIGNGPPVHFPYFITL